jgi:ketosteroid isomerase-like protein
VARRDEYDSVVDGGHPSRIRLPIVPQRELSGRPYDMIAGTMKTALACGVMLVALSASAAAQRAASASLVAEVSAAERGFAASMAARDRAAFEAFVAADAIFFGPQGALRGKTAVVAGWARFFEGEHAPFSWEPEVVEVLESGTLALTSGPVRDPQGKQIGTFNSVWRREADGRWRVIFDKGC